MSVTDPIARLVCGSRTLTISSGRYQIETDFIPPPAQLLAQMSDGTISNRSFGATKIGQRAVNRSWSFAVQCTGSSEREVRQAKHDLAVFLSYAGADKNNPLYLEYKPNSDVGVPPLWGQGGWLRYEVRHAQPPSIVARYGETDFRARNVVVRLNLEISPYAEGLRQRLASATGGVLEDTVGTIDGRSRGLMIPPATTNGFTNPIFGHSTYNNGWSTTATIAQNTDPNFVLFGSNSVKVLGNGVFYQSLTLTAATYTLSFYARRIDGAAVTSSDCQVYFNNALQTSTYTAIENGWYRISYTGTAAATPANYGMSAAATRTVCVDGFQVENVGFATPLAYGDLLGCAWTGTAHASTSTRTAARVRLAIDTDVWNNGEFTIAWIWKAPAANTSLATAYFWDFGSTFHCRFDTTNDEIVYRDGTNQVTSAAQTISEGEVIVYHATAKPGVGLVLYKNGVSIGTAATYTPVAAPTYLYIGTTTGAASHTAGAFVDFSIHDRALTSSEVLGDYNNLAPILADGQRVGSVPWLWTKDGDDAVDNYYDSTHHMHAVSGGIPGSIDAITNIKLTTEENSIGFNVYLALYAVDNQIDPTDFFGNDSGTADGDALGGTALVSDVSTGSTYNLATTLSWKNFRGGNLALLIRSKDAGSNLSLDALYTIGSSEISNTESSRVGTTYGIQLLQEQYIDFFPETPGITLSIVASRSSGSGNFSVDYDLILPGRICVLPSLNNGYNIFDYSSQRTLVYLYNSSLASEFNAYVGTPIEMSPDKYNYLFSHVGDSDVSTLTRTVTYNFVKVTPRYLLI